MAVVLVEFPCSFDGIHSETMVVGSERDFGPMTAGLVGMGWIADSLPTMVNVVEPAAAVVIEPNIEPAAVPTIEPALRPEVAIEPAATIPPPTRGKRK